MSFSRSRKSCMLIVLFLFIMAYVLIYLSRRHTKTFANKLTPPEPVIRDRREAGEDVTDRREAGEEVTDRREAGEESSQEEDRTCEYNKRYIDLRRNCDIVKGKYRNNACDKWADPSNLFWVKKRGFAICLVQKSASTYWTSLLRLSSSQPQRSRSIKNKTIRAGIMKSNGKVIFVRDPYSRLLAGYASKFLIPNPIYWKVGRKIVGKFRANASNKSLNCGHDVTFPEFISYVLAGSGDPHWNQVYQMCCPCNVDYEIVGKLESMVPDVSYITNKFNISVEFITGDAKEKATIMFLLDAVDAIFSRLRSPFLASCSTIEEGLRRSFMRLKTRGMLDPGLEFDTVIANVTNITQEQARKAILEAYHSHKMSSSVASFHKRRALVEAYRTLSPQQLNLLSEKYYPDLTLFGYDPLPPDIFNSSAEQKDSGYSIIGPPFF